MKHRDEKLYRLDIATNGGCNLPSIFHLPQPPSPTSTPLLLYSVDIYGSVLLRICKDYCCVTLVRFKKWCIGQNSDHDM